MSTWKLFWMRSGWTGRLFSISLGLAILAGCDPIGSIALTGPGRTRTMLITVQGTVSAASDGRPLAGATVEQAFIGEADPERPKGFTDSQGRYSFVKESSCEFCIPPIGLTLVAHLDGFDQGFEPRAEQLPVESWQRRDVRDSVLVHATQNFALRPTRPISVSIRGQVTNRSTGEPIETVTITVANHPWGHFFDPPFEVPRDSAETDADGRYAVVSTHFCAISGSSCFVSFRVTAEKDDLFESRIFEEVNVAGDSLSLTVDFEELP